MSEGKEIALLPNMANRHGLITGATETGKIVTLQPNTAIFPPLPSVLFSVGY